MADVYKLQYNGMTLAYPGWNGYVGYNQTESILDFGFSGLNNNVLGYVQYTLPDLSTGELTLGTGNEGQTLLTALPYGTEFSGYISANPYYRTMLNGGDTETFVVTKSTADPRKVSFSGQLTSNNWIGSTNTQQNKVVWTWTFNNNNRPNWNSNNGGTIQVYLTPNTGRMTIDSCYDNDSAYCCRLLADSNSGYWRGCTAKVNKPTNANIATTRIAAIYDETWLNVYQSAHIALTGVAYHPTGYWYGTAANGGQRGLKAHYLINSVQVKDPGKNINNNFYSKGEGVNTPTAFNVTGTGTNMAATNWNNQAVFVYATIGFNTDLTANRPKYPVNQITACTATVKCSAILP